MKKNFFKTLTALGCATLMTVPVLFSGCTSKSDKVVYVYNWGEYIDPDVLESFTEETGIKVIYDEYETNEIAQGKNTIVLNKPLNLRCLLLRSCASNIASTSIIGTSIIR